MIFRRAEQLFKVFISLFCAFLRLILDYLNVNSTLPAIVKKDEFLLLRLPLLARELVFGMLSPFELINLSMTSSKAKQAVTIFSRIKRFSVSLHLRGKPGFYIRGHGKIWAHLWTTGQPDRSPSYIIEHSKTPIADCLKRCRAITEVLGCPIIEVSVSSPSKSLTNWLSAQQSSIDKIRISFGKQEDVNYFLKRIRVLEKIDLVLSRCNFQLETPQELNCIEISNSRFINLHQLLKLNARFIVLRHSILTNREINEFLKSWMLMESHLNLEVIEIDCYNGKGMNKIMDSFDKVAADFKSMNAMRKINFSMTSSRARQAVTIFSRIKPRFEVTLNLIMRPVIAIKGSETYWIYQWSSLTVDYPDPITLTSPHNIFYIAEHPMKDCFEWYKRISGVLGRRIIKATFWGLNKSITDQLRSQQESIDDVEIGGCSPKDVIYFLKNIKVFGSLDIEMSDYNERFRMDIPEEPIYLSIRSAKFLKYEQFMSLNHHGISLHNSDMTNKDINRFLKSWVACKSHLNLKFFEINVAGPNAMDLLKGLSYQITTDPKILSKIEE
uniref:F-box domain-containing protein n=2 Tax=Caenorhabditis tropicalis TaxID=1561998 RepID=A0A1I7THA2_9PELO